MEGNHDLRLKRAAWDAEVPDTLLRTYKEIWETPRWVWHTGEDAYLVVDGVYYTHGHQFGTAQPALAAAKIMGRSAVIGHFHTKAGVSWVRAAGERRFGMDTGCGVDDQHPAMGYGIEYSTKSILGCGVVIDGMPYHERMPCARGEAYHRG